jgi:integrase
MDAAELHTVAAHLLDNPRSEALGWQLLLEALTGCRTGEVLRLRWDARHRQEPGFIEGEWLWLARSKGGVNPFAAIHPALRDCLEAMKRWRAAGRWRNNPFFVPSFRHSSKPASALGLTHRLRLAGPRLVGRHLTSHGLRSFYVTVRRSQGTADAQIAAEIGDKTGAAIIVSTYGSVPPNWQGQAGLDWIPKAGSPAWGPWLKANVVRMPEGQGARA